MKRIFSLILMLIPVVLFAQANGSVAEPAYQSDLVPIASQYSERFQIKPIYFNKRIDPTGVGEILEIEMVIVNLTDEPIDLNIMAVATFEAPPKSESSFEMPVESYEIIKTLVASPGNDGENFKYPVKDKDGNVLKDYFGKERFEFKKVPLDPKKGHIITVEDTYMLRTYHLCRYKRKNYSFFNEVAILIYDPEGKPVYYQSYLIDKYRR